MSEQGGNDQSQEKTLPPTRKRLEDARKKGQVIRSRELNTLLVVFGSAGALVTLGPMIVSDLRGYAAAAWRWSAGSAPSQGSGQMLSAMGTARDIVLTTMTPFVVIVVLLALTGPLVTGGVRFRASGAAPKASNLSLLKGFKRMVSVNALMELTKAILKFLLLSCVAVLLFSLIAPDVLNLSTQSLEMGLARSGQMLGWFFLLVSASLLVVAGIDLPFQIFQHFKKLRMSHKELRDELKETEGRPEVKQRIRALQMQASRARLESEVPQATVVVTNPTHYAVALRYDDGVAAPQVVARGAGVIAGQIRELAQRHGVPVVSAPPLARALYFGVNEGAEIPSDLYRVVARVMIYVLQLGQSPRAKPPQVSDDEIPPQFRRAEQ